MKATKLRKYAFMAHKKPMWFAALVLLAFLISAVTHPILSWTGPKAAKHRPPNAVISAESVNKMANVLRNQQITTAQIVKIVPSKLGNVLQVTQHKNQPRRYFDLDSGQELENFDQEHAIWLAGYYLNRNKLNDNIEGNVVGKVEFVTEFSSAYPWVNRLLPVYKIEFTDQQKTSAYIYTELNALASVGSEYKTKMQAIFRALHTWSWLSEFEYARLFIMILLMATLTLMAASGIALLSLVRSRNKMPLRSKLHRSVGYVVAVPLLGFCLSGFYHLLIYGFVDLGLIDKHRGMSSPQSMDLTPLLESNSDFDFSNAPLNHITLTTHDGQLYLRLSEAKTQATSSKPKLANAEHAHHDRQIKAREQRFSGQSFERQAKYISVMPGVQPQLNDKQLVELIAANHTGLGADEISGSQLITRFGMHYDFRNKRLPVWQIDFDSAGLKLFVDPATGLVVDALVNRDRYEGYSFSLLHKWNLLTPLTGRFWRDVLVVIILGLTFIMMIFGIATRLKR